MIRRLRELLGMDDSGLCRLLNVDKRTLARWEASGGPFGGTGFQVCAGLEEAFLRHPERSVFLASYIRTASAVGGLSYLLVKMFEDAKIT
jgi:transcriptional regulator with XRE-family HTH domain